MGSTLVDQASTFLWIVVIPPTLAVIALVISLAVSGKSFGLRELYVGTLIRIFEWGASQIEAHAVHEDDTDIGSHLHVDNSISGGSQHENDDAGSGCPLRRGYDSGSSLTSLSSVCSRSRNPSGGTHLGIIQRETQICLDDVDRSEIDEVRVESRGWAAIRDSLDFMKAGIESIIEDDVTSRFEAEQLVSWNMLTRTSTRFYHYVNWKLSLVWVMGFMFRYCLMLPFRVVLVSIGLFLLVVSTAAIGVIPEGDLRSKLNCMCMIMCCRILSRGLTAVVKFHDVHNRARNGGICVANHTSPIDVMLLSIDNVYALVGQRHSGLLGLIQHALSRASSHIWFERSETRDRRQVTMILRDHCGDTRKLPILIFPEGTCINNTSVMMFKKGSFEVGAPIYPIAMKYDSRFGDPFWNSSAQSWCEYVIRMMTSWAIICNIYYLPPMEKLPNEDAMAFASRVKKAIAARGGFVDLEWDGALKRSRVPSLLVAKQQSKYANRLSRYTSTSNTLDSELDGYIDHLRNFDSRFCIGEEDHSVVSESTKDPCSPRKSS